MNTGEYRAANYANFNPHYFLICFFCETCAFRVPSGDQRENKPACGCESAAGRVDQVPAREDISSGTRHHHIHVPSVQGNNQNRLLCNERRLIR